MVDRRLWMGLLGVCAALMLLTACNPQPVPTMQATPALPSPPAPIIVTAAPSSVPTAQAQTPTRMPTVPPAPTAPASATVTPTPSVSRQFRVQEYNLPLGQGPHDVAPAPDGTVWYTAQSAGELGRLNSLTGEVKRIPLGQGSRPHGVIVGSDEAAWVTDGGLNAIVRVDAKTEQVKVFPLPAGRSNANLNTAAFDRQNDLWFTGQNGIYGRLILATGEVQVFDAPLGRGPYGIHATPDGVPYYASLAGSHIARIDMQTGAAMVINPPTRGQGARRVWSDSRGRIWVSEWNAGQVGVYDPVQNTWREWKLPGNPAAYAVYVDERDIVWLTDFGNNAIVRFDPATEKFDMIPLPSPGASVRQLLGRRGEVWGAESGVNKLVVVRTGN